MIRKARTERWENISFRRAYPNILNALVKTDKKWDEGQVYIRQEWILEVDLKKRGVHVPALDLGFPKQRCKNAYPEK